LAPYTAEKGHFDVLFEASGNEAALRGALDAVRPAGSWSSSGSAAT
jgi:L-idonate 5-dehydrogenase